MKTLSTTSGSENKTEALMEVDNEEDGNDLLNGVAENTPSIIFPCECKDKLDAAPLNG